LLKKTLYIILAALGMGIAFDYLFFGKVPGISFPIYMALVIVAIAGMAAFFKTKIPTPAAALAVPLLFFSSMVFVWSGGLITFLNVVTSLYLLGLMLYLIFEPKLTSFPLSGYIKPVLQLPIQLLVRCLETLAALAGIKQLFGKHTAMPQVITGVLIAVPVIALFIALFASADLVFRKYVSDIFTLHLSGQFYGQAFVITLVALFFTGVFGYLLRRPSALQLGKLPVLDGVTRPKGRGQIEMTILFGSLNLLFLCFIAVQLTYLFGGQHNITGQGFTYAEYARKGYFELIAVAVISFLLIFTTDKFLLRESDKHSGRFKFLAGALIAQVIVIMVSAFNRLSLYESAYGFTSLRLYSHICIIWLAVVFGILLYKIFVDQRESRFALLTFLSVMALLVFVNVVNVDRYVAHRNIARYYATGKLDPQYLGELSTDAIPETVKVLDVPDTLNKYVWTDALSRKRQSLLNAAMPWQSTNLSRDAALRALNSRFDHQ
ncbi:MAG TPA: DUF4173 domain-containing protein, partial [Candidatus Saccharimonadales bacterium]|nr:DUF4173 domain-containing protein [Candidatus Saccharimonadales bacterium]